ncbi:hypothetical protein U1Q18_009417, partial [Sarracenia purpurea var. burkii]
CRHGEDISLFGSTDLFGVDMEKIFPEPLPSFLPFPWFVGVDIIVDEIFKVEAIFNISAAEGSADTIL